MSTPITYRITHAAGTDAGNASMRKAGRTRWNHQDWNAAANVMHRLLRMNDTFAQ